MVHTPSQLQGQAPVQPNGLQRPQAQAMNEQLHYNLLKLL